MRYRLLTHFLLWLLRRIIKPMGKERVKETSLFMHGGTQLKWKGSRASESCLSWAILVSFLPLFAYLCAASGATDKIRQINVGTRGNVGQPVARGRCLPLQPPPAGVSYAPFYFHILILFYCGALSRLADRWQRILFYFCRYARNNKAAKRPRLSCVLFLWLLFFMCFAQSFYGVNTYSSGGWFYKNLPGNVSECWFKNTKVNLN